MKLPLLSGKEVLSILKKQGFEVIRQRGSHVYIQHADGRSTVVPIHSGRDVGPGLLNKILHDIDTYRDTFLKWV